MSSAVWFGYPVRKVPVAIVQSVSGGRLDTLSQQQG